MNITTRTTIVSNVQLDDNIRVDCWKRKGLSRRRKLESDVLWLAEVTIRVLIRSWKANLAQRATFRRFLKKTTQDTSVSTSFVVSDLPFY